MSFEDFCVNSMAALHSPTHVHSHMVAKLSVCLARHLLALRPELFIGIFDTETAGAVTSIADRILDHTWHAALCHDIGKLLIIDTVAMYGRSLLDDEYANLRLHPDAGADLAVKHLSTRDYADVIRGHHLWYDGTDGYPSGFDRDGSPYRTIIDIVSVCDCMDAATDSVGRSYSRGKTFEEFEKEVSEAAGTRYAPWLPELFRDPGTRKDLLYLLDEGRSVAYRKTYALLRGI
ncbi:MAG: HD domain-containing protein [Lachnospiraceae bacterium]|nr:HD domain-containing protein [Lachnospiraceae bacterium]